ncbi:AFR230Cp [Eremothecium gossypii ATCC 10895]|uniref:AFR230Cp n=1 Tax=Eremothecium gossypii (strain ATCC 10895 / CBS 109.51 / FGSC 9923 / NRRL Y-1056) TaxID=284811 RepID=Q753U5_EREGS|nr:AFR230Cp [Eremothecium gossypii ATCC 10895]AAS53601.1 AFR230Cp [Eremothecium gossypii ATCC 10895]
MAKQAGTPDDDVEDIEKSFYVSGKEQARVSTDLAVDEPISVQPEPRKGWNGFVDTFRRAEMPVIDPNLSEAEKLAIRTAAAPLSRRLKNRHLQMIAIGGAIGVGLFVGSGKALATAGPAGVLIGWGLTATMILIMCLSLGELAVTFPVSGGYITYAARFIDESWGFANNFNYMMQAMVVMPLEIVAASVTVGYWDTDPKYKLAFVALFWVVIVSINLFGVRGFGEAESIFSLIKVITIIGFIIMGVVLISGGGPDHEVIGGKYWNDPGPFVGNAPSDKFKGVCSVFVTAAFSFAGSELIGLAAAETREPRKSIPKAAKQVFWRITLFYILSLLIVGLLVPSNNEHLLAPQQIDAAHSPFVIAMDMHRIRVLPSIINVVILTAVISVGNSSVYSSSRTMCALAEHGFLPKIFGYIDRKGRPLFAICFTSLFGLLCFVAGAKEEGEIFDWLLAISGLSSFFTWLTINLAHMRFRMALKAQGRTTNELSFTSPTGFIGSCYAVGLICVVLVAQFWVALYPPSPDGTSAKPSPILFFKQYLSFAVAIVMYLAHKIWSRNWKFFIKAKEMDIDTGRRELDLELFKEELAQERALLAQKPFIIRVFNFWC